MGLASLVIHMAFGSGPGSMLHMLEKGMLYKVVSLLVRLLKSLRFLFNLEKTSTINHHHHYTSIYETPIKETNTYNPNRKIWKILHEIKNRIKNLNLPKPTPPKPTTPNPVPTTPTPISNTSSYSPTPLVYNPPPSYNHTTTVTVDHYETTPEYGTSHKKDEYPTIYRPTKKEVYGEEEWPTSHDVICKKAVSKGKKWCRSHKLVCSVCSLRGQRFW